MEPLQSQTSPVNSQAPDPTVDRFRARLLGLLQGPGRSLTDELRHATDQQAHRLAAVIDDFQSFANSYFTFFTEDRTGPADSRDLSRLLQLLQQEADMLSRAGQQRLLSDFAQALAAVDASAKGIYDRFRGFKVDPHALPIIYVEKVFGIRRCLYTPFPLISVPLFALTAREQWEGGVAHELGHYIYWNSSTVDKFEATREALDVAVLNALEIPRDSFTSFQEAAEVAAVWHTWTEEVFADICGTMLLGPSYALSAMRLAEEADSGRPSDDHEHPSHYIRPIICIATLNWLASRLPDSPEATRLTLAVDRLATHWHPWVEGNRAAPHETRNITMGAVADKAQVVVETILGAGKETWVIPEGTGAAALGDLFDCSAWLAALPEDGDVLRRGREESPALPDEVKPRGGSQAFDALRSFLEKNNRSRQEVRQALLLISVAELKGQICHTRNVIRVADGTGKYDAC